MFTLYFQIEPYHFDLDVCVILNDLNMLNSSSLDWIQGYKIKDHRHLTEKAFSICLIQYT